MSATPHHQSGMHVGAAIICQNPERWLTDYEVYKHERLLADLVEPLGFDSIWAVEHHFTDYTMVPDVLQFLTYMAGRTSALRLGSMVVVLPWHDPMRVAEQIALLDTLSDGRLILGLGRGAGQVEFEGFRVPMGESRQRFIEAAELVLNGLERGYCDYQGEFLHQPRKDIRPAPFKSFKGRTYAAAVSPESSEIMARLGLGILIIPQKPWEHVASELETYRSVYRQVQGTEAPAPIAGAWVFCDENPVRAEEMARTYIGNYWKSVIKHYNLSGTHFAQTKGYEFYGKMARQVEKAGADGTAEFFMNLQVWGTPEECYDKILDIRSTIGNDSFVGVFSYGGMPYEEAERNLRLFAGAVRPELQKLGMRTPDEVT